MVKRAIFLLAAVSWCVAMLPQHAFAAADPNASVERSAASGAAHDTHAEKRGLIPDPTNKNTWYEALWVVIIFLVLVAILYPTAWKNVLAGLKKREERIRKDIADAEAASTRAQETLTEYRAQLATAEARVREMMNNAMAEGEKLASSIRMRAQQEAEETKNRATKEIDAARKQALADIYAQAAELSTSIAEKILRRNINAADQQQLVRESLEQLQSVGR